MSGYAGVNIVSIRFPEPSVRKADGGFTFASYDRPTPPIEPEAQPANTVYDDGDFHNGHKRITPTMSPSIDNCNILVMDVGNECIYNRVWVTPDEVEAGFITAEQEHNIYIWNAFEGLSKTITAVTGTGTTGTDLDYTAPYTLKNNEEVTWVLTIELEGPPTQETYYYPVVDSVQYSIYITGTRMLSMTPEPNWGTPPSITYGFQTVRSNTKFYKEQRRPLVQSPKRKVFAQFILTGTEAQNVLNTLSYGHDKIFGVPIFNEMMYSDNLAAGLTRIVLTASNEYLWNLNNLATHIMLIDHYNGDVDIEEIDEIDTTTSITLSSALPREFPAATTTIYTSMSGVIRGFTFTEHTTEHQVLEIEWEEYWSG